MDQLRYWVENSPFSVPICAVALIGLFILFRQLKVYLIRSKRSLYYQVAAREKLQIIEDITPSGADVPRIGGAFMGRQVDVSGCQKAFPPAGILTITRITLPHDIYLTRSVRILYNPAKNPKLQKVLIEGKEQSLDDLRSLEAFDGASIKFLENFLQYYCRGKSHAGCILDIMTGKACFDRDVSTITEYKHFVDSMTDFSRLINYMEKLSRRKEIPPLKSDNF